MLLFCWLFPALGVNYWGFRGTERKKRRLQNLTGAIIFCDHKVHTSYGAVKREIIVGRAELYTVLKSRLGTDSKTPPRYSLAPVLGMGNKIEITLSAQLRR
jgi:hypothetical protein